METVDVKKGFGAEVRRRRNDLGWSQEDLADRADLHRTYVSDVEAGKRNPSLQSMQRLAVALGASIGTVFGSVEGMAERSGLMRTGAEPGGAMRTSAEETEVEILLVEDDPHDIELTMAAFKKARLTNRVEVLHDGAEALDFVFCQGAYAKRSRADRPQLVLLDLQLPKVHGLEVLRRIRSDQATRMMPVAVLTGSRKDEHLQRALELGADAYLVKPVDFQSFSMITPKFSLDWTLLKDGV